MANLVCKRVGRGPQCSDIRLETTEAEQDDCLANARRFCYARAYRCMSEKFQSMIRIRTGSVESCLAPGCLGDLGCYDDACWEEIKKCYCTGLVGLLCSVCEDEPEEEETGEPPTTENVDNRLKNLGVTASSYDLPIPIPFGRVILPGNIIWIGNSRKEERTVRNTAGNVTVITRTEYGFVDMAVQVCAGPIEAVTRIWLGDTLVQNQGVTLGEADETSFNRQFYDLGLNVEILYGSRAQNMLERMAQVDGYGRSPAYRDTVVLLFKSFPVFTSTNSLPAVRVEVLTAVDESEPNFEQSALGLDLNVAGLMDADDMSRRVLVSDGSDLLHVNMQDFEVKSTLTDVDPIPPENASMTPEGDIVYQLADGTLTVVRGGDHQDRATLAAPLMDLSRGIRAQTFANVPFISITGWVGPDLLLFRYDPELGTITLDQTFVDASPSGPDQMVMRDINDGVSASPAKFSLSTGQGGEQIDLIRKEIVNIDRFQDYAPSFPPFATFLFPGQLNAATEPDIKVTDILIDDQDGTAVLFAEANSTTRVLKIKPITQSIVWQSVDNVPVPHAGSRNLMRAGQSRDYQYIAGDDIWKLDLETGDLTFVNTVTDLGAPALDGPQWYDGSRQMILYLDEDGELTRLFLARFAAELVSVADIIRRTLLEVGFTEDLFDVSAVEAMTIEGYLIRDQNYAVDVLNELVAFFHLSVSDGSGRLTFRPLGTGDNADIEPTASRDIIEKRLTESISDLNQVTVQYYDLDREGTLFQQSVGRDSMQEFVDYVANTEDLSYRAAVFTDGTRARRSAEIYLLKTVQRQDRVSMYLAPRHLAVEPSDFVNSTHRVKTHSLDVTLEALIEGMTDDPDIYAALDTIEGVTAAFNQSEQTDYDAPVANYPVLWTLPPLGDNVTLDVVHAGLVCPDSDPYVPSMLYTRVPGFPYAQLAAPAFEAPIGRVIQVPNDRLNPFSYDDQSVLIVEFNKPVPLDLITPKTIHQVRWGYHINTLFVGNEVMQYTSASVDLNERTVTFSGFQRGLMGTDEFVGSHVVGERVAIYHPDYIKTGQISGSVAVVGAVAVATFDDRNVSIVKVEDAKFDSKTNAHWKIARGMVRHEDSDDVRIRAVPRAPFKNTFTDNGVGSSYTFYNKGGICAALLAGPYDSELFAANHMLNNFPVDDGAGPGDNPYIIREFLQLHTSDPLLEGHSYIPSLDGRTATDDMHMIFFVYDTLNFRVLSTPLYYFFDGSANYDRYRPGLQVV